MRYFFVLTGLFAVGLSPVIWDSPLWPHVAPADSQNNETALQGVWTLVCHEIEGKVTSSLPAPFFGKQAPKGGPPKAFLARFNKDVFETGPDNPLVPPNRNTYVLNPANKIGAMDITPLDKDAKPIIKDKIEAIYLLKDDYLIICQGVVRPEHFTTSLAPKTTILSIYRRGKQK